MIATPERTQQLLLEELDRRNTYVMELIERIEEAKKEENYHLVAGLRGELLREGQAYAIAYNRYVELRPKVIDVPEHGLRERQYAAAV